MEYVPLSFAPTDRIRSVSRDRACCLTTEPAASRFEPRPRLFNPKNRTQRVPTELRVRQCCDDVGGLGSPSFRRCSKPHHPDLHRPEERLHALGTIWSKAVAEVERASPGIVTDDPEKGIALADGHIEQALTDTGSPVRPPDIDGVQGKGDLDAHFFGGTRHGETDHLWLLNRNPHHPTAGDVVAP